MMLPTLAISIDDIPEFCTTGRVDNSPVKHSILLLLTGQKVNVKEASGKVFLQCAVGSDSQILWYKDGNWIENATQLDLGAIYDDPRGIYTCEADKRKRSPPLQVHYRSKCRKPGFCSQDCLEFSPKQIYEGTAHFP